MCQEFFNFSVSKILIRFYIVDLLGVIFLLSFILLGVIEFLRFKKESRLSTIEHLTRTSLSAICLIAFFSLTIKYFGFDVDFYAIISILLVIIINFLRGIIRK